MTKASPDARPQPPQAQPEPDSKPHSPPTHTPSGPDPAVLAREEKIREEFQKGFGNNLRAARLKAALNQSEVARQTRLTQQYLSLIEAGQQNLTLRTMIKLAEVVGSDLLELLERASK
jgi:DNA-binding XRE family transcriptional regulator